MTAAPQTVLGLGPGDWLALSFADPQAGLCGQVRVEHEAEGDAVRALIAVFARGESLALDGLAATPAVPDAGGLHVGPLELGTNADGSGTARFAGEEGQGAFALTLGPLGARLQFGPGSFQQPCRAHGEVVAAGETIALDGIGQVGRGAAGEASGPGGLERDVAAWLADGAQVALRATRAAGQAEHDSERVIAALADADAEEITAVDEARLSTAYTAEGRPLRSGLELWPHEDSDYPRRIAGEVLCAATIFGPEEDRADGRLRWDIAFLDWRMEGRSGVGPYSLLRR